MPITKEANMYDERKGREDCIRVAVNTRAREEGLTPSQVEHAVDFAMELSDRTRGTWGQYAEAGVVSAKRNSRR